LDSASNAYIVGCTGSSDFPTTPGAFQFTQPIPVPGPASTGIGDGFVTKMNTAGSGLVYSTYLGGNDFDWAIAVAVDSDGNAYITGNTGSIDFPTTPLAFQFLAPANGPGDNDAFVTKLNNTGTLLVYSTYLGGSADESGNSIAIDSAGDAFVTGTTYSNNFPITPNAIQPAPAGGGDPDAFVLALNPQGTALVYSSYLGASGGYTLGAKIALDSSSSAYVVGTTSSASFPTTPGAFQSTAPQPQGHTAGFVTKVANITCGTSCP